LFICSSFEVVSSFCHVIESYVVVRCDDSDYDLSELMTNSKFKCKTEGPISRYVLDPVRVHVGVSLRRSFFGVC